ncbi:MAG: ATP-binding protein [Alphaproteobacteria bacterium]
MIRRLWPGSLAGRVAVVLLAGLAVLCAAAAALYLHDRGERTRGLFARAMAVQVAAMADLVEATPRAKRPGVLAALGGPMMRVRVSTTAPDNRAGNGTGNWKRPAELPGPIRRHLKILDTRPLPIRLYRPWEGGPDDDLDEIDGHRRHGGHRMIIAVGLRGGEWLHIRLQRMRPPWRWGRWRMGPWVLLLLTVILVVAGVVWAAHRMTRPLRLFAEAADRFGVDVRAPPLPEGGSRELSRAAAAFNRMQDRLRRFVDDRTMMLAAISHDLRSVLTRLRLRAEFIEDLDQQDKAIADIDEMQSMLEETLSFARDDAREEAAVETDLAALLQGLCETMSESGPPLVFAGSAPLPATCRPVALRRAIRNLLDNAVRYGGGAEVSLSQGKGEAVIEIIDDGPGVPEDMREKVFQPFFRLEGSRSRETGGTGLGLSSARAILRRQGGDIALQEAPGGGLLARLTLPL